MTGKAWPSAALAAAKYGIPVRAVVVTVTTVQYIRGVYTVPVGTVKSAQLALTEDIATPATRNMSETIELCAELIAPLACRLHIGSFVQVTDQIACQTCNSSTVCTGVYI